MAPSPPPIDRDRAIALALARAVERGWGVATPVQAIHRRGFFAKTGRWEIDSDPRRMGAKARFVVDDHSGDILDEGYVSR